ncbi:MAG: hypothetical protein KAS39_07080, partial [Actinomycetia bacterium]|nr:hypothetical protein [Actinomycetes bacterium]
MKKIIPVVLLLLLISLIVGEYTEQNDVDIFRSYKAQKASTGLKVFEQPVFLQKARKKEKFDDYQDLLNKKSWSGFYFGQPASGGESAVLAYISTDNKVFCYYNNDKRNFQFSNDMVKSKHDVTVDENGKFIEWIEQGKMIIGDKEKQKSYTIEDLKKVKNIESTKTSKVLIEYGGGMLGIVNATDRTIEKIINFEDGLYSNADISPVNGSI